MPTGALIPAIKWSTEALTGTAYSGALLYTFLSGTTTPQDVYSDSGLTTPLSNPLEADAAGVFPVFYTAAVNYRIRLETSAGVILIANTDNVYDFAQLQLGSSSGADLIGYLPGGDGAIERTVQSRLRDFVSVFDFMTTAQIADVQARTLLVNVAAAIQAAIDSLPALGGTIWLPPGSYLLGTTSLTIPAIGVRLIGAGLESTILSYSGTSAAIKNSNTSARSRITLADFAIDTNEVSGAMGIDFTYFSYSRFERLLMDISGTNQRGFYGSGTSGGSSPYYNVFDQCDIAANNHLGSTTGTYGYYFDQFTSGITRRGPNGNLILGGRISGCDTSVYLKAGNGNQLIGINSESVTNYHLRVGNPDAEETGTATSATDATLTDSGASWTTNSYANGAVKITGGTGSGQVRKIASNTGTALTLETNWRTLPDGTSAYAIYPATAFSNDVIAWRVEGQTASNPDFIRQEPSGYGTRARGGEVSSLGSGLTVSCDLWRMEDVWMPGSYRDMQAYTFVQDNVAANQTGVALTIGASTVTRVMFPYDFSVVGITIRGSAGRSGGTLTVTPTIDGVEQSLSARMDADVVNLDAQMAPIESITAGGLFRGVGVNITTDGSWSPTTADIAVTVFIQPLG